MFILLDIFPKSPNVLLKYMWGLYNHLQKQVILSKLRIMYEPCVHTHYLETIGQIKGYLSGLKKKQHQEALKEGNKNWKQEAKNKIATTHPCKGSRNNSNHCNIDGHIKESYWMFGMCYILYVNTPMHYICFQAQWWE